jgi:hypothetical protein
MGAVLALRVYARGRNREVAQTCAGRFVPQWKTFPAPSGKAFPHKDNAEIPKSDKLPSLVVATNPLRITVSVKLIRSSEVNSRAQ